MDELEARSQPTQASSEGPPAVSAVESPAPAGLLDILAEQMRTNPLPALQQTAYRLGALMTGGEYEVRDLSRAVMQDQAFTALVLQVANSIFYRRTREQITTITRAILMLGEDQLRRLAVKAACADLAKLSPAVRRVARRALLAASQAEALCGALRIVDCERVVLGSLLANFGELAVAWYLPDHFAAIEARIATEGCDRRASYEAVMGVPVEQVSSTVGAACGLPEEVVCAGQPVGEHEALIRLAGTFAERLERADGQPPSENEIQETLATEGLRWPVSATTLKEAMLSGLESATVCSKALGLGADTPAQSRDESRRAKETASRPASPEFLQGCIKDLAVYLTEPDKNFNAIVSYILEGLYRGAGFDHVGIALRMAGTDQFVGRMSFGSPEIHGWLSGTLNEPGLLADCVRSDAPVRQADPGRLRALLPKDLLEAVKPAWVALGPLIVRRRPIGVVVADCRRTWPEQDEFRWQGFTCLLAQANAGLALYAN